VRAFGPKGDGRTLDTKAINQAIAAAAIGQRLRTFFTPL
jgi:polygalacturonase